MTQKMCDKAVNRCFFKFYVIPNQYKNQGRCERVVSEGPFLIVYCPDKYKTQWMRDEAVDDSLASLELIPYWFFTSKMIKNLFTALHADENIPYFNEDPDNVVFFCNEMSILNIDLNHINLLMKIILILSFLSDFWVVILNLKNTKKFKKNQWRIIANSVAS